MAGAIDDEANENLRNLARDLMNERFDGSVTKFARGLGMRQPSVSDFLSRKRGAGMALIRGLAKIDPVRTVDMLFDDQTLRDLRFRIFAAEASRIAIDRGIVGGGAVGPDSRPGAGAAGGALRSMPGRVGEGRGKRDSVRPDVSSTGKKRR